MQQPICCVFGGAAIFLKSVHIFAHAGMFVGEHVVPRDALLCCTLRSAEAKSQKSTYNMLRLLTLGYSRQTLRRTSRACHRHSQANDERPETEREISLVSKGRGMLVCSFATNLKQEAGLA